MTEASHKKNPGGAAGGDVPTPDSAPTVRVTRQSLVLEAHTSELAEARTFVERVLAEALVPEHVTRQFVLAVDEAVTSMLREASSTLELTPSAAGSSDSGTVELTIDADAVRVIAEIRDSTVSFGGDLQLPSPQELQALLERSRRNELGIFLMRSLCDEVHYSYQRGFRNTLRLLRFVPA